jgi:hypothetical protein
MKRLTAPLLALLLLSAPPAAQAQNDGQHLSAEDFLSGLDAAAPATPESAPVPASAEAEAPAESEAEAKARAEAEAFFNEGEKQQMEAKSIVRLRTIDKLSARTHTFEIPVSKTVKFGDYLFIKARACRSASPLSEPENAAFLQIWERLPVPDPETGAQSRWIFSGWMFSSNPSLSAMEHPVYDVWVIACKNDATVAASATYSAEKAPEAAPEDSAAADKPAPAAGETPAPKPVADTPAPAQMAPVAPVSGGSAAVPALQELPGSFEGGDE